MKSSPSSRRAFLMGAVVVFCAIAIILVIQGKGRKPAPSATPPPQGVSAGAAPRDSGMNTRPPRGIPREADRMLKAEGARTDVTLSAFPIKEYQHLPSPNGKAQGAPAGEAYIHVPSARRRIAMEANQIGEFPAIETMLNDTLGVRLSLNAVKPETPVRVVILDGGSFPAAQGAAQVLKAAKWGGVAFEYTTSGNIGFHRVLVQAQGKPSRILNFNATDGETWPPRDTVATN